MASRGRLALAIYLDWIVFSVPWAFVHYALLSVSPAWNNLSTLAKFILFAALEVTLHRLIKWSPGATLLSVRYAHPIDPAIPRDVAATTRRAVVNATVKARESWFTVLVGVLLLLDGTKTMVRWTMWAPPAPFFGDYVSDAAWPVVAVLTGLLQCGLAVLFFRLRVLAGVASAGYFALALLSTIQSWNLWDGGVAEMTRRRRAYQGLPVRADEIERMQSLTPEVLVVTLTLYIIAAIGAGIIIFVRRRRLASPAA